jgi:hypothetical protein
MLPLSTHLFSHWSIPLKKPPSAGCRLTAKKPCNHTAHFPSAIFVTSQCLTGYSNEQIRIGKQAMKKKLLEIG